MADMGTVGDTRVTGVTGAIRNPPAKEQSIQRRPAQRPIRGTVAPPLQKQAIVIGTDADLNFLEAEISDTRRLNMSKTTATQEQASHEPKSHGCCGGSHTKDEKAQSAPREQVNPHGGGKDEHPHVPHGRSGCCGGGKTSK